LFVFNVPLEEDKTDQSDVSIKTCLHHNLVSLHSELDILEPIT